MEGKLIFTKIPAIMADVDPIAKGRKNVQQGYQFRGIDDMYNALQSLFQKHKVFITTTVIESKREDRLTKSGGSVIYTVQKICFRFYAEDGSFVESILEGEGMDSGDKSTNKASSAAQKYALIQMFLIPTEGKKDSEEDDHELVPAPPKQAPAPQQVKKLKATEKAIGKAIERIESGEPGVIEKMLGAFELTDEQLTTLNNTKVKAK